MISDDEAAFYLSSHESYNKDTFLETGWPLMSHLFDEKSTEKAANVSDSNDGDLEDYDYENEKDETDEIEATTEAPQEETTTSPENDAQGEFSNNCGSRFYQYYF